jgi:hypothetical protein
MAVLLSISIFSQSKSINIFERGNEYSINLTNLKPELDGTFDKLAPHFTYVDTLKAYYYLKTAGKNFDEKIFEGLIYDSRKYNKYFEPSLHLSFQFYSFKRDSSEVLKILSDIVIDDQNGNREILVEILSLSDELINLSQKGKKIIVKMEMRSFSSHPSSTSVFSEKSFRFSILDIYFCPFFKTKFTFWKRITKNIYYF